MIPVISPPSVTSSDPTFASTIRFTASNTEVSASIRSASWPFSSRISDNWFSAPPSPCEPGSASTPATPQVAQCSANRGRPGGCLAYEAPEEERNPAPDVHGEFVALSRCEHCALDLAQPPDCCS